jgi:SHS2 domain-containing protein
VSDDSRPRRRYEEIDHTGDLALRVWGRDLGELHVNAAEGMFGSIGRAEFPPEELRTVDVAVEAPSVDLLLREWLRELLRAHATTGFFPVRFERVDARPTAVRAVAVGGAFDPDRHEFHREIKAVTLHGLRAERDPAGGWVAEVVFDV